MERQPPSRDPATHLHQRQPLLRRDAELLELLVADALQAADHQRRRPERLAGAAQACGEAGPSA